MERIGADMVLSAMIYKAGKIGYSALRKQIGMDEVTFNHMVGHLIDYSVIETNYEKNAEGNYINMLSISKEYSSFVENIAKNIDAGCPTQSFEGFKKMKRW